MLLPKRKRTLSPDPMAVVSRFVDAANRHDAEGVEACLHPDFESIQPTHPGRNFKGSRQVRRNWQAIFQAEPGFRLTVLRSSVTDDTAWVELHGAGEAAEVAGVLVFGIEGGRLRWSRIYSEMVEQAILPTDGSTEPPPPTAAVPTTDSSRPVFEVIQGEGGLSEAGSQDATGEAGNGETTPAEAASAAGPESVGNEEVSAGSEDAAADSAAATETLVGSESAPPIEDPAAPAGGAPAEGAPGEGAPAEGATEAEPEVEAKTETPDQTTDDAPKAAKAAARRRKPRAGGASGGAKTPRSRKKPTE